MIKQKQQDFSEVAGYNINIYKPSMEVLMVAKIPFTMLTKKIKYFGINITRNVQYHARKMLKILLKDTE